MDSRKEQILEKIVLDFIENGEPVGSSKLADFFDLSSATIRNEMVQLEKSGLIFQPHISAGRVPTEKGYQHYISNFLKRTDLPKLQKYELKEALQEELEYRSAIKNLAKEMSIISGQTVIIAFQYNDVFYTGISNLFSKPEFSLSRDVCRVSALLDDLNDVVYDVYDDIGEDVEIFVGKNNPLGKKCSALMTKYNNPSNEDQCGLIAILGPMRMPYDYNITLLEYCRDLINLQL